MELKQFHLPYHYRGVEVEMVCLTESRYNLVELIGIRNATAKRLAYFDGESIEECRENPNVVYVRRLPGANIGVEIPSHPITLDEFMSIVDAHGK